MVIAITKSMEYLKNELAVLGYEVVSMDDRVHSYDAVVYGGAKMPEMSGAMNSTHTTAGVFMVNGENKTAVQIDAMLRHRLYSPLFQNGLF